MGLALAMSDPWWVGNPFICHQQIPSQMWGHFPPGKRYSPALLSHQIGNLRDCHEPPQPKTAKPDLWDPATSFWAHPGMPEMWPSQGMLDGSGGLAKVMIYSACATSLQRAVVLATLIWGLIVAEWQATQLTYKQLRHTNSRYPQ